MFFNSFKVHLIHTLKQVVRILLDNFLLFLNLIDILYFLFLLIHSKYFFFILELFIFHHWTKFHTFDLLFPILLFTLLLFLLFLLSLFYLFLLLFILFALYFLLFLINFICLFQIIKLFLTTNRLQSKQIVLICQLYHFLHYQFFLSSHLRCNELNSECSLNKFHIIVYSIQLSFSLFITLKEIFFRLLFLQ